VIVEAIRILEERSKPQAAEVDSALAELLKCETERNVASRRGAGNAEAGRPGAPGSSSRGIAGAPVATAAAPSSGGADTRSSTVPDELRSVRRRSQLLREDTDRHRSEVQRQLVDARATLGPLHPTVVALNDKVGQLTEPAPELKMLDEHE